MKNNVAAYILVCISYIIFGLLEFSFASHSVVYLKGVDNFLLCLSSSIPLLDSMRWLVFNLT